MRMNSSVESSRSPSTLEEAEVRGEQRGQDISLQLSYPRGILPHLAKLNDRIWVSQRGISPLILPRI